MWKADLAEAMAARFVILVARQLGWVTRGYSSVNCDALNIVNVIHVQEAGKSPLNVILEDTYHI